MDIGPLLSPGFTIQSATGANTSGDPVYGPQRTITAVIRTVNQRTFTPAGESYRQVDVFMTDSNNGPILTGDRFWPPGADTSNNKLAKRLGRVITQSTLDNSYTIYRVEL